MIKQERLEQALKFLSETDEQHAKLIAGVDYLKDLAKNMKGKFIVNCETEKSVAMKEHAWYASDHYKKHIDSTTITAISYFHDIPKTFTGGDLVIESRLHIPCLNNSLVIFPSILWHEVTPVEGTGRYAMSQFISMA